MVKKNKCKLAPIYVSLSAAEGGGKCMNYTATAVAATLMQKSGTRNRKTPQLLQRAAGSVCFTKQKRVPTPISEKALAL